MKTRRQISKIKARRERIRKMRYYPKPAVVQKVWTMVVNDKRVPIPLMVGGVPIIDENGDTKIGFWLRVANQTLLLNGEPLFKHSLNRRGIRNREVDVVDDLGRSWGPHERELSSVPERIKDVKYQEFGKDVVRTVVVPSGSGKKELPSHARQDWNKHRNSLNLPQAEMKEWHWKDMRAETNNTYSHHVLCPKLLDTKEASIGRTGFVDYKVVLEEVSRMCGCRVEAERMVNLMLTYATPKGPGPRDSIKNLVIKL